MAVRSGARMPRGPLRRGPRPPKAPLPPIFSRTKGLVTPFQRMAPGYLTATFHDSDVEYISMLGAHEKFIGIAAIG